MDSGNVIVTYGEKSKSLSLYDVNNGSTISRGLLSLEPTSIASDSIHTKKLALAYPKYIKLLNPC